MSPAAKSSGRKRRKSDAPPRKTGAQKKRAGAILASLEARYPDAHCELDYRNPLQLLIATILSAQATDVGVNKATPKLFAKFKTAQDFARATPQEIEPYIASIGLFRSKAKAVHSACTTIVEQFGGQVPRTMDELLTLRGVARKTANVVLGNAFDINEGVVVDTHVARVAHRFGLTRQTEPRKIERDLMVLFPREKWCLLSHLLIFHGRRVCKARGAMCSEDSICRQFCSNGRKRG
ncbi:MAG: endonuclease III [Phycisphaerales bacterium]|nr:endonuclease III [Phycisphaerales bacterium]